MTNDDRIKSQMMRLAISPSGFTFDPQTGRSFTLNPTGLDALGRLREGRDIGEVAHDMAKEYNQSSERVESELEHFWYTLGKQLGISEI